jgi:hypothetical protein
MLTFFRRIRKGLIDNSSARKYLLYAIGEITLVVIGILIALQINNWNEWRKDRIKEEKSLQEIIETLDLNVQILSGYIEDIEFNVRSKQIILDVIDNKIAYSDTLDRHFLFAFVQWSDCFVSYSGFDALKNNGIDLILSASLRQEIITLFESSYAVMKEDIQNWTFDQFIFKYMDENFIWYDTVKAVPKDFNFVMNDHYFLSIVHRLVRQNNRIKNMLSESLNETQRVLQLIKEELHCADISNQDDRQ